MVKKTETLKVLEKILGVSLAEGLRLFGRLTPKESQAAELMAKGLKNKQIAEALAISPKTLDVHRSRIFMKFDMTLAQVANTINLLKIAKALGETE